MMKNPTADMRFDWSGKPERAGISEIARILRRSGAVALLPTETVYGLTGRVSDPLCRQRIMDLKHRDPAKHLGWFVSDLAQLEKYGITLTGKAAELAGRFCPGPLTLIVDRNDGTTVGFRIPDHPLLLALLRELDEPLLQTSANRSGCPNALNVDEALSMLSGTPDAVADAGAIAPDAQASTIVDCTAGHLRVIRQGMLRVDEFL